MKSRYSVAIFVMLFCLGLSLSAAAEVPQTMTYQGNLTDSSGAPVDTTVEASFRLFDAETNGTEVWSETFSTLDVINGSFSAQLGQTESLADVLDGSAYWLEVAIEGETMSPRNPVESVPYAWRSNRANEADSLQGLSAGDVQAAIDELSSLRSRVESLEANLQDTGGSPINIAGLESRIGQNEADIAANTAEMSTHTDAIAGNASDIAANTTATSTNTSDISANATAIAGNASDIAANTAATSTNTSDISANATAIAANTSDITANTASLSTNIAAISTHASDIATNSAAISANTAAITAHEADIAANTSDIITNTANLSANATAINANQTYISTLQTLTQDMDRTTIGGHPSITFTGVNLHVRSGSGTTDGDTGSGAQVNGLGNLIIGYDEARSTGSTKSGSHNLVVGSEHNYASYGGLVAGFHNTVEGTYASVTGGQENIASGNSSSVSGGANNLASGTFASVSGGVLNTASGFESSVSGGYDNTASGAFSSVSGGESRSAPGDFEWRAGSLSEAN